MKGKVNDFVRKIFIYKEDDARGQVDTFVETSNVKIRNKFEFILRYIADEKNQFKEPYVKHFSIEKYKRLYELRLKVTSVMSRIIFCVVDDNVILLHAFIKKDRRDTEQALEYSLKLLGQLDEYGKNVKSYLKEVKIK